MQLAKQDAAIKARAYAIWEEEGRPHGRDWEHWLKAKQEFSARSPAKPAASALTPQPGRNSAPNGLLRRFFMARGAL